MEVLYLRVHSLHNLKEQVESFILLSFLLGVLYFVSVYLAEKLLPRPALLGFIFLAALIFRLTLLPLSPSLSDDLYRYRWEGKVQQAGFNPYKVHPSDPALAFLRDETYPAVSGPEYATVYGPLLEMLYWVSVTISDHVILLKLPFVGLDLGVVLLLFRWLPLLGISPMRAIIYAWSPLTVVEFAASGHNDSLPVFAFVLALFWFEKQKKKKSLAALAVSALSKLYAGFLLPVFLTRSSWKLLWVPALAAAVLFAPYATAWQAFPQALGGYMRNWRNNDSFYYFLRQLTETNLGAWRIYLAIVAAVIVYCLLRQRTPARSSFLILGAVLLFSPNVFPWYLTWVLPLLAVYPNPAWLLWTVTIFLHYHVLIPYRTLGLWQEETVFKLLEYIPFYALLLGGFLVPYLRQRTASHRTAPGTERST
ncbi:MAG: hypothetical protein HY647_11570 [Acidobacteria bacterium]|nr:hypothetical protein [Acidobacteriota bacterium]